MFNRTIALFFLLIAILGSSAHAQRPPASMVGWYNGDWQTGIGGLDSYYTSETRYYLIYDDFVVPDSGWTITGVFAHLQMDFSGVEAAFWEIRTGLFEGDGGTVIASGVSPAAQILNPSSAYAYVNGRDTLIGYRIAVDGLNVPLAPGRYWLTVAPVSDGKGRSFIDATRGFHAAGIQRGDNGLAFVNATEPNHTFRSAETIGKGGTLGVARDFSQGVIVATAP